MNGAAEGDHSAADTLNDRAKMRQGIGRAVSVCARVYGEDGDERERESVKECGGMSRTLSSSWRRRRIYRRSIGSHLIDGSSHISVITHHAVII